MSGLTEETWDEDEAILHSLQSDIVVTDPEGIILKASKATGEIYKMDYTYLLGKSVYDLQKEGVFTPILTPMVVQEKRKITCIQTTAEGNKHLVTGIPVFNNQGELVRVVSYSHDVTELLNLKDYIQVMEDEVQRVKQELHFLRDKHIYTEEGIVAHSADMERTLETAARAAETDANILLLGESGVGKSHIAKFIHNRSARAKGPFIEVNCGAIPDTLFEAEFFGYEPGAFTGASRKGKLGLAELASQGTLFLDEVGELTSAHQIKLLNFIQNRKFYRVGGTQLHSVDIRIIAATNQNISEMIQMKQFREDLYFRLSVLPITIPPLRDRREDILPLIKHFLALYNKKYARECKLDGMALEYLISHSWKGNVRELINVIEQLVAISAAPVISVHHLPSYLRQNQPTPSFTQNDLTSLSEILESVEKQVLLHARERYRTTVKMARVLGISQPSVTRKLKKYNIK